MLENEDLEFQPSPFFNEQLTAFELWLEHGSNDKKPPEQLPIVLQVSSKWCCDYLIVSPLMAAVVSNLFQPNLVQALTCDKLQPHLISHTSAYTP